MTHSPMILRGVAALAFLLGTMPCLCTADGPADGGDDVEMIFDVKYREGTVRNWSLDLALPKGKTGLRPAIVVIHGGGWIEGDKSSFSRPAKLPPGNIRDFARQGFVAATINYR